MTFTNEDAKRIFQECDVHLAFDVSNFTKALNLAAAEALDSLTVTTDADNRYLLDEANEYRAAAQGEGGYTESQLKTVNAMKNHLAKNESSSALVYGEPVPWDVYTDLLIASTKEAADRIEELEQENLKLQKKIHKYMYGSGVSFEPKKPDNKEDNSPVPDWSEHGFVEEKR